MSEPIDGQKPPNKATVIAKLIFTHGGLFALVSGYCVGGAYLFQFIEYPRVEKINELIRQNSYEIETQRARLAQDLWKYKSQNGYEDAIRLLISEYHKNVSDMIGMTPEKYVGYPLMKTDLMNSWVFSSALLYTITTVTSIGYGNPSPRTPIGQVTSIFYAMIGVPLMLMFLANVGDAMAKFFRFSYSRGCCYFCWKKRKQNYGLNKNRLTEMRDQINSVTTIDDRADFPEKSYLKQIDYEQMLEDLEKETINVPISLTLVVIAAYVFVGAVLFAAWNQWSWTKGGYFTFITLSTIGFGDVVPGFNEVGTTNGDLQMAVSVFYIVFGLAVLSMSFNLMMEEMLSKFKWVGTKLGIVDPENDLLTMIKNRKPLIKKEHSTNRSVDTKTDPPDQRDPQV